LPGVAVFGPVAVAVVVPNNVLALIAGTAVAAVFAETVETLVAVTSVFAETIKTLVAVAVVVPDNA